MNVSIEVDDDVVAAEGNIRGALESITQSVETLHDFDKKSKYETYYINAIRIALPVANRLAAWFSGAVMNDYTPSAMEYAQAYKNAMELEKQVAHAAQLHDVMQRVNESLADPSKKSDMDLLKFLSDDMLENINKFSGHLYQKVESS